LSTQPQTCDATGNWQNAMGCSGAAPYCVNGGCSVSPGASCQGAPDGGAGLSNCGYYSNDGCCTSLEVAGGTFFRTYQVLSSTSIGGEQDSAKISGFRLDKYDVTVGRFRQFQAAWNNGSGYLPPAGSGKHTHLNNGQGLVDVGSPADAGTTYETGWLSAYDANVAPTNANLACNTGYDETWTAAPGTKENLPVNCVNWYEAYAFCIWDGGFLPSEAEYGYAEAGGSDQRMYPWGINDPAAPPGGFAIYNCNRSGGACTGADIARVGFASNGAGRWGQLDLVGNVYKLVLDWNAAFVNPCTDCANLSPGGTYRMTRGGYFDSSFYYIESSTRPNAGAPPTGRYDFAGFRCARVP
jgi:formylglycine-generating enzyme required for sulfatase activity